MQQTLKWSYIHCLLLNKGIKFPVTWRDLGVGEGEESDGGDEDEDSGEEDDEQSEEEEDQEESEDEEEESEGSFDCLLICENWVVRKQYRD